MKRTVNGDKDSVHKQKKGKAIKVTTYSDVLFGSAAAPVLIVFLRCFCCGISR